MDIDHGNNYHSRVSHNGTSFIIDKLDDGWLVTQSSFIVKKRGEDLEKTKQAAFDAYDSYLNRKQ